MKNIFGDTKSPFMVVVRFFAISISLAFVVSAALIMPDVIWPFLVNVFSLGYSFVGAFCVAITAAFVLLLSLEFFKIYYATVNFKKESNNNIGYIALSSFLFMLSLFVWMASFWGMLHSPFQLGEGYVYFRHVAFFCALTPAPILLYKGTKVLFSHSVMMEDAPAPITVIFFIICTIFYFGCFSTSAI